MRYFVIILPCFVILKLSCFAIIFTHFVILKGCPILYLFGPTFWFYVHNVVVYYFTNLLTSLFRWGLKGALSDLRQFLATESPLKVMKNIFCFTSKALFVLKIFKFLPWLFCHVAKQLDQKDHVNVKFYKVTAWLANNCNKHITHYLEK